MAYITSTLLPTKGSHPISCSTIRLSSSLLESCTLHLYFALPPILLVDTHELMQWSAYYSFEYWGTKDLELPVFAVPDEVSELLINVGPDGYADEDGEAAVRVEVPMHLRYGKPANSEAKDGKPYQHVAVDWPHAFLRCSSTIRPDLSTSPPKIPLHVTHLETDSIFISIPPHTNFSDTPQNILTLPLGNSQDLAVVEPVTALVILACFLWLLKISWKAAVRLSSRPKLNKVT